MLMSAAVMVTPEDSGELFVCKVEHEGQLLLRVRLAAQDDLPRPIVPVDEMRPLDLAVQTLLCASL